MGRPERTIEAWQRNGRGAFYKGSRRAVGRKGRMMVDILSVQEILRGQAEGGIIDCDVHNEVPSIGALVRGPPPLTSRIVSGIM